MLIVLKLILLGDCLARYKVNRYIRRVVCPVDYNPSLLTLIILNYDFYNADVVGVAIFACTGSKYYRVNERG